MARKIVVVLVVFTAALGVATVAAGQTNTDEAKQLLKEGIALCATQDFATAAAKYEDAIRLDPNFVDAYFALANIQDASMAEQTLERALRANPNEPRVYGKLADHYSRLGDLGKAFETFRRWADAMPDDPEPRYSMAAFYWDRTYRDRKLTAEEKRDLVTKGILAVDEALALNADHVQALVMKGLLLRMQASYETNRATYDDLVRQATELSQKAIAIQKKKQD
jgi:tetratricopeptide (TPR) repeat protein